MNNDPNRRNRDNDDIAATPVAGSSQRRFNPLWFLLLLIPLLLLPFCHHRDTRPDSSSTPQPTADATTPLPNPTASLVANPFTLNASGPDAGKAVLNFDANATTSSAASASTLSAVVAYLQATANFGEAYPVTDNSNPQARELNRRVEITLVK